MISLLDNSVISSTFVGRAPQLTALESLLIQAEHRQSKVVLVSGEAGIGKSRLVAETRDRARHRGWQVAQGRCFEADLVFPYAPLIDLARTHLAVRTASRAKTSMGSLAPELVTLLPELALSDPELVPTAKLDPESEKRRLFETFVQFSINLMYQAAEDDRQPDEPVIADTQPFPCPLLLIIEDMHWSDDTSLELVRYLARRLVREPLLLLLTYRSDEVQPTLQHFLAALSREQRPTELTLSRFTSLEVDAMLRDIFDLERPVHAEFLNAIYDLTAGNPFFVEEVLKSLIAAGDLFYSDGAWDRKPIDELRIPHSVQDAVQRRTVQLSEAARHTLTVAAVAGQQFDFDVLQAVTNWPEADLSAQIKEFLAAQLTVELSAERFAFRHALTRQAIYSELLTRERRALHQQIGEILEEREAEPFASRQGDASTSLSTSLAYHFFEAGAWEKALIYARRAGEHAQALYTPRAAIEQFTRALQAARRLKLTTVLPDLYRERGLAYETVGDFELARADLESVLQISHTIEDRQLEWRTLVDLGKLWSSRDYAKTGDYFRHAVSLARTLDDPESLARSLNWVGNWHLNMELPQEALRDHREALAIFEALADRQGLAQTLDLLGMASYLAGESPSGSTYLRQAVVLWESLDERKGLAASLCTLSVCGIHFDSEVVLPAEMSIAQCLECSERAAHIAGEIGWRAGETFALLLAPYSLMAGGQYGLAKEGAEQGLKVAREIGHRQWLCLAHRILAVLHLDLLDLPAARNHLEQALVHAKAIGTMYHAGMTTAHLILYSLLEQNLAQAEALLADMPYDEFATQSLVRRWHSRVHAEYALARGIPEQTLQITNGLIASSANAEAIDVGAIPVLGKLHGEALTALRRWTEAEDSLLAALATAQAQETPRLAWRIHVALGKLYRAQEQYAKASNAFAAARIVIDGIAASIPDVELRDGFVRNANAMMSPPQPSTPLQAEKQAHGGLTRREREVAVLVAEGKSNREIAEILVLGVRTIEGHVSNILGKLDFNSRTEIAVWVVETSLAKDEAES